AGSSHPRPELRLVVKNDVAPRDEPWTLKLDPAITHKPGVARSRRHVRTEQNMGSDHEAISSVIGSTEDARNALVRCIVPAKHLGQPAVATASTDELRRGMSSRAPLPASAGKAQSPLRRSSQ